MNFEGMSYTYTKLLGTLMCSCTSLHVHTHAHEPAIQAMLLKVVAIPEPFRRICSVLAAKALMPGGWR